jgi:hypothetical protein
VEFPWKPQMSLSSMVAIFKIFKKRHLKVSIKIKKIVDVYNVEI